MQQQGGGRAQEMIMRKIVDHGEVWIKAVTCDDSFSAGQGRDPSLFPPNRTVRSMIRFPK
jgi:hypothetical protein